MGVRGIEVVNGYGRATDEGLADIVTREAQTTEVDVAGFEQWPYQAAQDAWQAARLGFVESLSRPGGNITGTANPPVSIGKGWAIARHPLTRTVWERVPASMTWPTPKTSTNPSGLLPASRKPTPIRAISLCTACR